MTYRYAPYYCEENIYLLAEQLLHGMKSQETPHVVTIEDPVHVLFITNAQRSCMLLHQGAAEPGRPVFWDYHVILVSGTGPAALIWDLDTRLEVPCPAGVYLESTFPVDLTPELTSLFRVISADTYLERFSSDRRHMRAVDGTWLKPPPAWPCLAGGQAASPHELGRVLDLGERGWGPIVDRAAMVSMLRLA